MMLRRSPFRCCGLIAALALGALGLKPGQALADPPPGLFEATETALATCSARGGEGRILEGYEDNTDLNGDGLLDYITDLGRIACGETERALCSPEGCGLAVWLSQPDGAYRHFDLGLAIHHETLLSSDRLGLPRLNVVRGAAACADAGLESAVCSETWSFAGEVPEATDLVAPPPLRPAPRPPAEALPRRPAEPGWTLRKSADGSLVALGISTGNLQSLGAFCLQETPFLVLRFAESPPETRLRVAFSFSSGTLEAEALFEESAGDAFVIDLSNTRLAGRLAGPDVSTEVRIDDALPVTVSLRGSTASLRSALAACYSF